MNNLDKPKAKDDACGHLSFIMENDRISAFFPLLQQGVMLRARVGCSVQVFLEEEVGVARDIIEKIQSIFLDGRPVDDLTAATVRDGSVLALSAAMPGLVGATLRRGGTYSSFRNTITYHEDPTHCPEGEGLVRIKLFNLLMHELGPGLLKKGVFVPAAALTALLAEQPADFWQACRQSLFDGEAAGPQELPDVLGRADAERVFFSVNPPDLKT